MDAATPLRTLLALAVFTAFAGCRLPSEEIVRRDRARSREVPSNANADLPDYSRQYKDEVDARRQINEDRSRIEQGLQERGALSKARPQAPGEPAGPLAPLAPLAPTMSPPAPIQGLPVSPAAPAVQTGFSVPAAKTDSGVPAGDPRIKIIAHVGEKGIVTDEEVWEACRQRLQDYVSILDGGKQVVEDPVKKKAVYQDEFRRTIERELILDEMYAKLKKANKMAVIEEIREFASKAADRQLREFKKRYKAESDDEFKNILLAQGLTVPVIRRQIERQLMAEEYVRSMLREKNRGVSLAEVRDWFDAHAGEYKTADRVKWLGIFISYNKFATQREAYDYALAIQQHAAAGEDFVALSKTYDQGLSGQANGLGVGGERGKIQPADVEPAVFALKPGEVSQLIETPAGYHIVKVAERQVAGIKPFDDKIQAEVRRRIQNEQHALEYKRLVEKLWRSGVVKVVEMPK